MSTAIPTLPPLFDLLGTAVFALTGALLAARLRQTFGTMGFFARITGVGGGSVRDLLIGAPVFWVRDPWVAPVCLGVALLAWFTPRKWWEGQLLEWADAAGLAAYAVLGTAKALAYGLPPVPAVLMGVITGCVGGIIR
ncbi:MAG: trimeric intracellular cation channel family protein, partial [Novosphingobium sp.]